MIHALPDQPPWWLGWEGDFPWTARRLARSLLRSLVEADPSGDADRLWRKRSLIPQHKVCHAVPSLTRPRMLQMHWGPILTRSTSYCGHHVTLVCLPGTIPSRSCASANPVHTRPVLCMCVGLSWATLLPQHVIQQQFCTIPRVWKSKTCSPPTHQCQQLSDAHYINTKGRSTQLPLLHAKAHAARVADHWLAD